MVVEDRFQRPDKLGVFTEKASKTNGLLSGLLKGINGLQLILRASGVCFKRFTTSILRRHVSVCSLLS